MTENPARLQWVRESPDVLISDPIGFRIVRDGRRWTLRRASGALVDTFPSAVKAKRRAEFIESTEAFYSSARASNPKPKKRKRETNPRSPVALSKLADVSEHGRVLDLVVRDGSTLRTYSFPGRSRPLLTWSPKARALVWWEGVKIPAARRANALPREAAAVWERFHGAAPTSLRVANVPDDPGPWRKLGTGVRIGYRNPTRWGRDDAEHTFTSPVTVHRAGTRPPYLWIVRGGTLRMTARGIEG